MALTDYWQLLDKQVYNGKPLLNVYHLKRILAGADAGDVAQAFVDSVLDGPLDSIQVTGLTRTTVEVSNLGDATDFTSIDSSSFAGVLVGDPLPSFNSASIQFNRTRTDMKNGSKRWFVGTEAEQLGGDWVVGMLTLLTTLRDAILAPWEDASVPGVDVCSFTILKRFCVVPGQDPCQVYRLPDSSAEVDAWHYVPLTATVRTRVRSQVSRKVLL